MLEYSKMILEKVSFDHSLFEKELKKSKAVLIKHEIQELEKWCKSKFGSIYPAIISKCFKGKKQE